MKTKVDLTKRQIEAIEWLGKEILAKDGLHSDEYEYKQFELYMKPTGKKMFVSLVTEVGRIDDEGTMASVFARTRRHIFIGVRGGLKLVNPGRIGKDGRVTYSSKKVYGSAVTYALTK